jgi:hypothetical protein
MNIIEVKLNAILNHLFANIQYSFGYTQPVSVSISLIIIIIGIIIIVIVLASAFWSAQLAEKERKKRFFHFLGGLIIPWLYPLFIYKKANSCTLKIIISSKQHVNSNAMEPEEKMSEDETKAKLFAKIATDENGVSQGPFIFSLIDNTTLKVQQIIDVQDNLIVVNTITTSGENKKIRIPYSYIKSYSKTE